MALDKPIYVVGIFIILVLEIAYITLDSKEHFKYFRDFMDAVILLTFILAAYFVYEYLKAKRLAPARGAPTLSQVVA